jgi:hypothetical protein
MAEVAEVAEVARLLRQGEEQHPSSSLLSAIFSNVANPRDSSTAS